MNLGFIGTGVMGAAIVRNLLNAGYTVNVYNRTKSKTDELVALGAVWHESPKAVTQVSDLVFTMVGYPSDVEETYYSEQGIFATEVAGKILIDMTTSTPTLAEKIAATATQNGAEALDAPVSGGDVGAKNGTLTIMVGGNQAAFDKLIPIFEVIGSSYSLQGTAGKGQHTKMANQIMIAGTMLGMSEMLVYAQAADLDLNGVIKALSGGGAANWSMANYGPRILKGDYAPGFYIKHYIKDLKIALDEAKRLELNLPMTALAEELYEKLAADGLENEGTQALIKYWWSNEK